MGEDDDGSLRSHSLAVGLGAFYLVSSAYFWFISAFTSGDPESDGSLADSLLLWVGGSAAFLTFSVLAVRWAKQRSSRRR